MGHGPTTLLRAALASLAILCAACSGGGDEAGGDASVVAKREAASMDAGSPDAPNGGERIASPARATSLAAGVLLMGGNDADPSSPTWGEELNDVFASTDMGNWSRLSPHGASRRKWSPRCPHVVFFKARYWVVGGATACHDFGTVELDDVWSSPDGVAWTRVLAAGAPFGGTWGLQVVVFNGRIYALGGIDPRQPGQRSSAWSSDDGVTWQAAPLPYSPRTGAAVGVLDGALHVVGGIDSRLGPNGTIFDDEWVTADGQSWTRLATPAVGAIQGAKMLTHAGRLILLGGATPLGYGAEASSRAVWSSDGVNGWQLVSQSLPGPAAPSNDPEWSTRSDFIDAVVANGRLWVGNYAFGPGAVNTLHASSDGGVTWVPAPRPPLWTTRNSYRFVAAPDPQIAAGGASTCSISSWGAVSCWGSNDSLQLGHPTLSHSTVPLPVAGLASGAVQLALGGGHACALRDDAGVVCWGRNDAGQLGTGMASAPVATPATPVGLGAGVRQVASGRANSCAVMLDGALKCWGAARILANATGGMSTARPVDMPGLGAGSSRAVAVGDESACVVRTSGAVQCWGEGSSGELGNGSYQSSAAPVDVVGIGNDAVSVSAQGGTACAVLSSGEARCWGDNRNGTLGDPGGPSMSATPVSVMASIWHRYSAVAAGEEHVCGLVWSVPGYIRCWGAGYLDLGPAGIYYGQLGAGPNQAWSDAPQHVALPRLALSITSGRHHSCVVLDIGSGCAGAPTTAARSATARPPAPGSRPSSARRRGALAARSS